MGRVAGMGTRNYTYRYGSSLGKNTGGNPTGVESRYRRKSGHSRTDHYSGPGRFNGFSKLVAECQGKVCDDIDEATYGPPDYNWKEFATESSFEKMKKARDEQTEAWRKRISKTGLNSKDLALALEKAGAAGIVASIGHRALA